MSTASLRTLVTIGAAVVSLHATAGERQAQTFRCAEANGQSQYQQWPCAPSQTQRVILVADARTTAQRTQAADIAEREQRLLRDMSRDTGPHPHRAQPLTVPKRKTQAEPSQNSATDLKRIPRKRDFRAVHKADGRARHPKRKPPNQVSNRSLVSGR